MAVAKEQIRQIISENNISSVADVYSLLKESFKDILQELMEAELEASLGYGKNQKGDLATTNKRNGHSPKTLKSQYGEFQVDVPTGTGMGSLSRSSSRNTSATSPALRRRSSRCMPAG